MPDQPNDPINYDMKIPPETKENKTESQDSQHKPSGAATESSSDRQRKQESEKHAPELPSE